jgi:hypothetical protein
MGRLCKWLIVSLLLFWFNNWIWIQAFYIKKFLSGNVSPTLSVFHFIITMKGLFPHYKSINLSTSRERSVQSSQVTILFIILNNSASMCLTLSPKYFKRILTSDNKPVFHFYSPERGKFFLLSTSSRPTLGPTQPPIQWVRGHFPRGKAAGAWSWQLTSN